MFLCVVLLTFVGALCDGFQTIRSTTPMGSQKVPRGLRTKTAALINLINKYDLDSAAVVKVKVPKSIVIDKYQGNTNQKQPMRKEPKEEYISQREKKGLQLETVMKLLQKNYDAKNNYDSHHKNIIRVHVIRNPKVLNEYMMKLGPKSQKSAALPSEDRIDQVQLNKKLRDMLLRRNSVNFRLSTSDFSPEVLPEDILLEDVEATTLSQTVVDEVTPFKLPFEYDELKNIELLNDSNGSEVTDDKLDEFTQIAPEVVPDDLEEEKDAEAVQVEQVDEDNGAWDVITKNYKWGDETANEKSLEDPKWEKTKRRETKDSWESKKDWKQKSNDDWNKRNSWEREDRSHKINSRETKGGRERNTDNWNRNAEGWSEKSEERNKKHSSWEKKEDWNKKNDEWDKKTDDWNKKTDSWDKNYDKKDDWDIKHDDWGSNKSWEQKNDSGKQDKDLIKKINDGKDWNRDREEKYWNRDKDWIVKATKNKDEWNQKADWSDKNTKKWNTKDKWNKKDRKMKDDDWNKEWKEDKRGESKKDWNRNSKDKKTDWDDWTEKTTKKIDDWDIRNNYGEKKVSWHTKETKAGIADQKSRKNKWDDADTGITEKKKRPRDNYGDDDFKRDITKRLDSYDRKDKRSSKKNEWDGYTPKSDDYYGKPRRIKRIGSQERKPPPSGHSFGRTPIPIVGKKRIYDK